MPSVSAQDVPVTDVMSEVRYVNAAQAAALLETNDSVRVLDVRTKGEYERGHLEGATQINYFSPSFRKSLRGLDRESSYLVHCKSGGRSTRALKIMQEEGFNDIIHLDGGYDALMAHKLSVNNNAN